MGYRIGNERSGDADSGSKRSRILYVTGTSMATMMIMMLMVLRVRVRLLVACLPTPPIHPSLLSLATAGWLLQKLVHLPPEAQAAGFTHILLDEVREGGREPHACMHAWMVHACSVFAVPSLRPHQPPAPTPR